MAALAKLLTACLLNIPTACAHAGLRGMRPVARSGARTMAANVSHISAVSAVNMHGNLTVGSSHGTAPCQCEVMNPQWKPCARTTPKCIFVDLGAADGNSFHSFLSDGYGKVANCPSGLWEAFLIEANPRFELPLQQVVARFPDIVHVAGTTAAFDCEGKTTFYLDVENHGTNYWGSSLSSAHPDVQKSKFQGVSVSLMNLNRLLYERTIPADWVMVKMDIEGAEWDILPCLAKAQMASLIDRLYMEQHSRSWGLTGTTQEDMESAKAVLRHRGVDIPSYFSETL